MAEFSHIWGLLLPGPAPAADTSGRICSGWSFRLEAKIVR
ncbi:hypothetical protein CpipJ_CPIJ009553 [Culex quinquefasciatus]|uniref:Uncharacterized protein n=1 Tax=Culex quinquefasciatus TaxID=7176 RepID=B0WQQ4_CULQU|nr:hypothetical protein CpipJ_CPIJ009553 [Culex quinquefasciatus]|eukprot:XP_001851038.1 hypothetical protein CpipJ_CPIJ009553 [Culex quinquefasciatus]